MPQGLQGLQPFEAPAVYSNTPTGMEGRDPSQWGTPNDPSHGVLGAGDTVTPATGFTMAPGDEFAFGDIDSYLVENYHGVVLDTTPINPPGVGVDVGVPLVGMYGWTDPRWQEMEAELVAAHQIDTGGPLRRYHVNPLAQGTESVTAWEMRATNRGSTYDERGALVSLPGSDRPALDISTHNRAKMLKEPIVDYGERPVFNNIAAVTTQSEDPRSILSPSNRYNPAFAAINPGRGVIYAAPQDPEMVAPTVSSEVPIGLEWM